MRSHLDAKTRAETRLVAIWVKKELIIFNEKSIRGFVRYPVMC
jgi:hypothetical protein